MVHYLTFERERSHNCLIRLALSSALMLGNETKMKTRNTEQELRPDDQKNTPDWKTDPSHSEEDADTGMFENRAQLKLDGIEDDASSTPAKKGSVSKKASAQKNNVRKLRMERMMSKAELARRAGLSTLTIDRVERGMACRMDTKRKILEALGLTPSDRVKVFGEDD